MVATVLDLRERFGLSRQHHRQVIGSFATAISKLYPPHPDESQHRRAVNALRVLVQRHGVEQAKAAFSKLFKEPSLIANHFNPRPVEANARAAVINGLGALNDAHFLEFMLKEGFTHRDPVVRLTTIKAFGQMGRNARTLVPTLLVPAMRGTEPHPVVRSELAALFERLSRIKTPVPRTSGLGPRYSEIRRRPAIAATEVRRK